MNNHPFVLILLSISLVIILVFILSTTKQNLNQKEPIKITICFLIRDGDKYLKKNIDTLIRFFNKYNINWRFVYIENDSIDKTKKILDDFKRKYPNGFHGKSITLNNKFSTELCNKNKVYNCSKRTTLLARLRQQVLNLALKFNSDGILMMDMDYISFRFDKLYEMIKLWWNNKKIDAIFGMSVRPNGNLYDTGAIESKLAIKRIKKSRKLVRVKSAFSGFGLYRTKSILKYSPKYRGNQIEHISFNSYFKEIYVHPLFNPIY